MPRGGPRPGAGRKSRRTYFVKGEKYKNLKSAAKKNGVVKSTILNWCKSEKKPDCWIEAKKGITKESIEKEAAAAEMDPLDYMLKVMRDETEEPERRDKMAYYAAPYCHSKATSKTGKKQEAAEKAGKAGSGKFKNGKPPLKRIK